MKNNRKFELGDRVRITKGRHKGSIGTVVKFDTCTYWKRLAYRVKIDGGVYDIPYRSTELEKYNVICDNEKTEKNALCQEVIFSGPSHAEGTAPYVNNAKIEREKCILEFDFNPIKICPNWQVKDLENLSTKIICNDTVIRNRYGNYGDIEKKLELSLSEAKEMYKAGGKLKELALRVYTEQELKPLPRTWYDYCYDYLNQGRCHYDLGYDLANSGYYPSKSYINGGVCTVPTEELAQAFLALMQLMSLRNVWIGDWKFDWKNTNACKHVIEVSDGDIGVFSCASSTPSSPLIFPTKKLACDFFDCFKDLIEKAKILI